ncbi:MAG: hypothetical protein A3B31_00390 [Candidatus Komeilibacteria bacterium RIFCSPLOWO2_01_FULL_53_11]|uniref:Glycosyltransferase 2-like domain-containing protein n=1 Tax=Candidatus Komeilibacteria bacterium RIFCSPLOWO2_01_FULL_53_11 TaxID=1798552 RepID=A0A1G2BXB2_9BACT|nr:MAG: hypothetical protein A3B31_00390 [Candidatus Komeilibacteria bacterium RIFCSPLOWO2_01_FULL_53_11]
MDVSVIIVNYKSRRLIMQQLRHFFSTPTRCAVEVLVVDNASQDGIVPLLAAEFPQVKTIELAENKGFGSGNNAGIAKATGRYIVLCNPDIVLTAAALDMMCEYMDAHAAVGMIGPRLINADGSLQYSIARFPGLRYPFARRSILEKTRWGQRWTDDFFMRSWAHDTPREVDWMQGSCMMVRHDALRDVGGFDRHFFMYLEDTDLCWRFWERGYRVVYLPSISLIHLHRRSSEGSAFSILFNSLSRAHLISFFRYMLKHIGRENPHIPDGPNH